jgi:hypothetical protein
MGNASLTARWPKPSLQFRNEHVESQARHILPAMDELQKHAAELVIRLLQFPADRIRNNPQLMDDLERVATQVIKDLAAARSGKRYLPGERSGYWQVVRPGR